MLFWGKLNEFHPHMTLNTVKLVYYHSPMSVLGICIHSNQSGMEREHFSDVRWDFDNFRLFKAILGEIWPILPLI